MFVEYTRHCYESEWRLFKDSELTTAGKYFFSPPNAIAFPGRHHLGSRDWHDKNWRRTQGLGEVLTARHTFHTGKLDGVMPEQVFTGTLPCHAQGETKAADLDTLFNGWPEACYIPPPVVESTPGFFPLNRDFERISSFTKCGTQRLCMKIIEWMYDDDSTRIINTLNDLFENTANITFHPGTELMPSVLTIVHPQYAAMFFDGTRNFQQLAEQAFSGIEAPVDIGLVRTLTLWNTAGFYGHNLLVADGVNDLRPIFLCGHSYGAAAALCIARAYRYVSAERIVRYLTFGCPKIGDDAMVAELRTCDGWSMANDDDLVTILPPDRVTAIPFVGLFPLLNFAGWYDWRRPPTVYTQYVDGQLRAALPDAPDFLTLFSMIQHIALLEAQSPIAGHSMSEYSRRAALRCPDPGFPINTEVLEDIDQSIEGFASLVMGQGPATWGNDIALAVGGFELQLPTEGGGLAVGGHENDVTGQGGIAIGQG